MEHFHIWKKEEKVYDLISHFYQFIPHLVLLIKEIRFEINSPKFHFTA